MFNPVRSSRVKRKCVFCLHSPSTCWVLVVERLVDDAHDRLACAAEINPDQNQSTVQTWRKQVSLLQHLLSAFYVLAGCIFMKNKGQRVLTQALLSTGISFLIKEQHPAFHLWGRSRCRAQRGWGAPPGRLCWHRWSPGLGGSLEPAGMLLSCHHPALRPAARRSPPLYCTPWPSHSLLVTQSQWSVIWLL